jgi:hypothetical protein
MVWGDRKSHRVTFHRKVDVTIVGIDGTWRRDCVLEDISDTGARLIVGDSIEGLNLKEFFLLLSSVGVAYRRCELVRVNGVEIGVRFLKQKEHSKEKTAKILGNPSLAQAPKVTG